MKTRAIIKEPQLKSLLEGNVITIRVPPQASEVVIQLDPTLIFQRKFDELFKNINDVLKPKK